MKDTEKRIIAMWSGPRNLSTAMMRAFENRPDCMVWDEPFYAAYLKLTGLDHPMREEILTAHETDAARVAAQCQAGVEAPIFYQKHMTHHMVEGVDRSWMASVSNAFLIRHPARVVASYGVKHDTMSLADIGFTQQIDLFNAIADRKGAAPLVLDANMIRSNPEAMLRQLCAALGIPFSKRMLSWPTGRRESDGVWAAHWYDSVEKSTGFAPPEASMPRLSDAQKHIVDQALPIYETMQAHALKPDGSA